MERFQKRLQDVKQLEEAIGLPSELVIKKQLAALDSHMVSFIAESPFMVLGTYGSNGCCDVSPRGDLPAVATVLDPKTLIIPDRPGNRRTDSLRNIIETGKVGLLFLVPGLGETLRINGRACVTDDEELLTTLAAGDKPPVVGIGVEVEECYFQCAKALIRSKLWSDHAERADATSRHFAEILIDQTGIEDESIESLGQQIEESYKHRLY